MAELQGGEEAKGIKLFGTTITFQERQLEKHDDQEKKTTSDELVDKRPDKIIPCPRCKSMETKFCYFNNYNVNQPRHFCKGCQRYWTAGGVLRNVPVGAGRRKARAAAEAACRGMIGFSESCSLYDGMQQFEVEWSLAGVEHGGFQHVFPVKRRRSSSNGQTACW